eukprot:1348308-Rhodomonas_salina.2
MTMTMTMPVTWIRMIIILMMATMMIIIIIPFTVTDDAHFEADMYLESGSCATMLPHHDTPNTLLQKNTVAVQYVQEVHCLVFDFALQSLCSGSHLDRQSQLYVGEWVGGRQHGSGTHFWLPG